MHVIHGTVHHAGGHNLVVDALFCVGLGFMFYQAIRKMLWYREPRQPIAAS